MVVVCCWRCVKGSFIISSGPLGLATEASTDTPLEDDTLREDRSGALRAIGTAGHGMVCAHFRYPLLLVIGAACHDMMTPRMPPPRRRLGQVRMHIPTFCRRRFRRYMQKANTSSPTVRGFVDVEQNHGAGRYVRTQVHTKPRTTLKAGNFVPRVRHRGKPAARNWGPGRVDRSSFSIKKSNSVILTPAAFCLGASYIVSTISVRCFSSTHGNCQQMSLRNSCPFLPSSLPRLRVHLALLRLSHSLSSARTFSVSSGSGRMPVHRCD